MPLIAVTGGIAAGKSTVSGRLRELGAIVVDADQVAREVVEPGTPALQRIREEFGEGVVDADGRLDRAALGAIVFAHPERRLALNAITHPEVGRRSRELFAHAKATDPSAVIVYDVPLLVDGRGGATSEFDGVIAVVAPVDVRLDRMVRLRGMSEEEARRRIAAQADDAARTAVARWVVDAGGELADTIAQTDRVWAEIRSEYAAR